MDELNRSLDTIEEEIIPTDQNEIIENIAKNYKVPITIIEGLKYISRLAYPTLY